MRGHNICFYREIRKLSLNYHQYPSLSVALTPLDSLSCFRHCLCTMILTWDDFEFQKAFVDIYNRQLWNNLRDREVNQAGIFYKASGPGASLEAAQVLSHPTPDNLCHRQVTFFFRKYTIAYGPVFGILLQIVYISKSPKNTWCSKRINKTTILIHESTNIF